MKELLLVCAVAVMIVFGYFIMKRLDDFLANNHHLIDEEIAENSLFIAFDNPMILDSLIPLFEKFSKGKPNCQLHFMFGNTEDIYAKLNKNRIDFGFIKTMLLQMTIHTAVLSFLQSKIVLSVRKQDVR